MTEIVLKHILLHYHFSDFEHKREIEYESQHKRHENEKTTHSSFSLNITKWFVNNHLTKVTKYQNPVWDITGHEPHRSEWTNSKGVLGRLLTLGL